MTSKSNIEQFLLSCLILDTETNSDDYKVAEIIEFGYSEYIVNTGWEFNQTLYSTHDGTVPPKVQSICYITDEMIADKPRFIDSNSNSKQLIDRYLHDGYLVAHNHFYDMKVLSRHGIDTDSAKWICTWRLAKKLFMGNTDIAETNLPFLRFALKLPVDIGIICHRAGHDSLITSLLLQRLVSIMIDRGIVTDTEDIGQQVYRYSADPIIYTTMPFGKHRGVRFEDIPSSYWAWAINNTQWFDDTADNFDPDLVASIAAVL